MRLLITGGSGYLGRHITELALKAGCEVINYDLVRPEITFDEAREEWVEGDLLDTGLLTTCFQCYPVDLVLHLALQRDLPPEKADVQKAVSLNVEGTRSLLWAMASVGCERLLALTGARVYGFCSQPYISEEVSLAGQGVFAESLRSAEEMILEFQQGLPGFAGLLRLFEVYGYGSSELLKVLGQPGRDSHLEPLWLWHKEQASPLYGRDFSTRDGSYVRDYLHVSDVAHVVLEAIQYMSHEPRLICNLGRGKGYSQLDLLALMESVWEKKALIAAKDRRPEEPARLVANCEYLKAWSGREFLDLKSGLKLTREQGLFRKDPQTVQCHPPQSSPPSEVQKTLEADL